ncbi:BnaAnng24110D [Brassica napus]|nr:BnaAnng24110D [Brassica napus]VDC82171.1 unnamed protein product [Brassica rapa]
MNSSKEVMFLGELEEVLEATQDVEFKLVWSIYSDNLLYASTVNIFRLLKEHCFYLLRETRVDIGPSCSESDSKQEEDKTEVKAKRKRTWKRSEDLADKAVMVPRLVSSVNLASIFESTG